MQSAVYGTPEISARANKSLDILTLFFLSDLVHRPVFNSERRSGIHFVDEKDAYDCILQLVIRASV